MRQGGEDGPRWLPGLLTLVSLLPQIGAAIPSLTYYARDFTLTYAPLRSLYAREVAAGRWPFWNPYLHEGCPFLPVFYPLEAVQALWSGPAALSWLLTLHFPIAALAMYALARGLGARRLGAFVSGAVYAMGGLCLSSLNVHWFLQALALAPLVALACVRAAERGGRAIPVAALVVALAISTLAVEFVAQGLCLGLALGLCGVALRKAAPRMLVALALGVALAAVPVALVLGILSESQRGEGFASVGALQFAVPPAGLLQVLVPEIFGSPGRPLEQWWGGALFDRDFPYFATIYLGPVALALSLVGGAGFDRRRRWVLLGLGLLGLWYALGVHGGLAPLLISLPGFRSFRYPSKAFLLPYLALSLLSGRGADRLARSEGWRRFAVGSGLAAVVALIVGGLVVALRSSLSESLHLTADLARLMAQRVPMSCLAAAGLAVAALGIAWIVSAGRAPAARGAALIAALLVLDLDLAGTGVNPQGPVGLFGLVPELQAEHLEGIGGRVFSYGFIHSPAMWAYLRARPRGVQLGAFFVARQMLTPFTNVLDGVEVAEGPDRLSLLPNPPALGPLDYLPERVGEILPRLRNAAVERVLSLDALDHPDLRLRASIPAGPPDLRIHLYDLLHPWPRSYVACHALRAASRKEALEWPLKDGYDPARDVALEEGGEAACHETGLQLVRKVSDEQSYRVEADGPGFLVVRDGYARGWRATLDGRDVPVLRANGRHRAVALPAGSHEVRFRYHPPGLAAGLAGMALAGVAAAGLCLRPILGSGAAGDGTSVEP